MYYELSGLGEHPKLTRFEKHAVKTLQHGQRYGDIFLFYEMMNAFEWCFCYSWRESLYFCSIYCFLWWNTLFKYQTWTNSYRIPWNDYMQREVPGEPGAGTSSYWVIPSNTTIKFFTKFGDKSMPELILLPISAAMFSMMIHRLIWTFFLISHPGYSFVSRVNISA